MTNKELMQILKRFPKTATIRIDANPNFFITAYIDERGEWTIELKPDREENQ